jgi:hypothetical protein
MALDEGFLKIAAADTGLFKESSRGRGAVVRRGRARCEAAELSKRAGEGGDRLKIRSCRRGELA